MSKQKANEDLHDNWEQLHNYLPKLLNSIKTYLNGLLLRSK